MAFHPVSNRRDYSAERDNPAHRLGGNRLRSREKTQYEKGNEKAEHSDIDVHAPIARREPNGWQWLTAKAFGKTASDGQHV